MLNVASQHKVVELSSSCNSINQEAVLDTIRETAHLLTAAMGVCHLQENCRQTISKTLTLFHLGKYCVNTASIFEVTRVDYTGALYVWK